MKAILEGATRLTAGDETCEFTSHGEGGRVPPFIEQILILQQKESRRIFFRKYCRWLIKEKVRGGKMKNPFLISLASVYFSFFLWKDYPKENSKIFPFSWQSLMKHPILIFLLLFNFSTICPGFSKVLPFERSQYVLKLYQRMLAIGQTMLNFETKLIARLKKKYPIDFPTAASRLLSCKKQMKTLRKLAHHLAKQVPTSDPLSPRIQSLKHRLPDILRKHRQNQKIILEIGGAELESSLKNVEEPFQDEIPDSLIGSFPVQNLDEQF